MKSRSSTVFESLEDHVGNHLGNLVVGGPRLEVKEMVVHLRLLPSVPPVLPLPRCVGGPQGEVVS